MKLFIRILFLGLVAGSILGCAAARLHREGLTLIGGGRVEEGVAKLALAVDRAPTNPVYRSDYISQRDLQVNKLLAAGDEQRLAEHWDEATNDYERARAISPLDPRPQDGLTRVARSRSIASELEQARAEIRHGDLSSARSLVGSIQARDAGNRDAAGLARQIEEARAKDRVDNPELKGVPGKLVSLHFVDGSVRMILEAIARSSGISIMLDQDIRPELLTSISVEKVSPTDAIGLVLQTSHLRAKVLDTHAVFVYPATPDKIRDYEDLVVKAFYLSNADVKRTEALLKSMLKIEDIFVDEKRNLLVVRGPIEQIKIAEKLVGLDDVSQPEVMLEVQVMEINRSRLTQLGISYPNQATLSRTPSSGSSTTLADFKKINPSVISLLIPSTVVNLNRVVTDADLLANPRVRVRNREHAKILIGDKLPTVTSTATSTGFVSENIQYLDVGLKLDVEPDIALDDRVSINVSLEVSTVVSQITTPGGSLAYDIGTRNASTVLELKDGETEVLAGLINDNDTRTASKIPGLGDFPVLGRLFSNHKTDHQKSEIILAITPHIVRGYQPTIASDSQFWSGTASSPRLEPLLIHQSDPSRIPATAAVASVDASNATSASDAKAASVPGTVATSLSLSWRGPDRVKVGESFTVSLHASTNGLIHSLPLQLSYDPVALEIEKLQEGAFFKKDGSSSLFASNIDLSAAKMVISAGRGGSEGVQGEGDIATISLKAAAVKTGAAIQVMALAPLLADGEALDTPLPEPYRVTITE